MRSVAVDGLSKTPAGFRVRPLAMSDLDAIVALMVAEEIAQTGSDEGASTPSEVRSGWTRPGFDLEHDAWVVATEDGRLAGYIEVRELESAAVESDGYVDPEFQGKGIGRLLLRLAEERAKSVVPTPDPARPRVLRGGIFASNVAASRLFEESGFRTDRYFIEEEISFDAPPPQPEWPDGVTVRSAAEDEDLEPIFDAVEEAFKDHWGERQTTFKQWVHMWREDGLDRGLWVIAESGRSIAGMSLGKMRRDRGYVATLGVLRPYRRYGLGLALLRESFAGFYRRGIKTVTLNVDAESLTGATRLYQRAGMREVSRFAIYRKTL